jgi:CMP-N,N'-diacetyllegionaminic acid synthase
VENNDVLAVVAARAGSKGLPGKNLMKIGNMNLVEKTIKDAIFSGAFQKIIVSSENSEIISEAITHGAEVPFIRPLELAQDDSTSVDVVLHAIDYFEQKGIHFKYVTLLEVTYPLRSSEMISRCVSKLTQNPKSFDGIVSASTSKDHPDQAFRINLSKVKPFNGKNKMVRRQVLSTSLHPTGGVYVVKTKILKRRKTFYPRKLGFLRIHKFQAIEIDDIGDFIHAQSLYPYYMEWISGSIPDLVKNSDKGVEIL